MSAKTPKKPFGKAIDAYKERRKNRLDEAGEKFIDNEPLIPEEVAADEIEEKDVQATAEPEEAPADKLQFIKDRRDRRDEAGDPESPEEAMALIAEMDEDIQSLLAVVEELQAQLEFKDANEDEDVKCEDEGEIDAGEATFAEEVADALLNKDGKDVTIANDKAVKERTKLLRICDRLNLDGVDDYSPKQIKRAVIKAVKPKMRLDGKSDSYIDVAFELAVDEMNAAKSTERQRRQMTARRDSRDNISEKTAAEEARERMNKRLMGGTE